MTKNILLLSLAVMFLHYSCSKDKTDTPEKALLKTKSWYHSIYDTIPLAKSEYIYDNFKRPVKINHFIKNTDTIFRYEYSDNLCIKENRFIDLDLTATGGYTLHFYEEDVLTRSEKYTLQNYNFQVITYSYDVAGKSDYGRVQKDRV
jgi:hypothetical protein